MDCIAHQAPLSVDFSRQEYWSVLPFPTPRDLLNPGIEPKSPASPVLTGGFFYHYTIWEAPAAAIGNIWPKKLWLIKDCKGMQINCI